MQNKFQNAINFHLNRAAAIKRIDPEEFRVDDVEIEETNPYQENDELGGIFYWLFITVGSGVFGGGAYLIYRAFTRLKKECRDELARRLKDIKDNMKIISEARAIGADSVAATMIEGLRAIIQNISSGPCRDEILNDPDFKNGLNEVAQTIGTTVEDLISKYINVADEQSAINWLKSIGTAVAISAATYLWALKSGYSPSVAGELVSWANANRAIIIGAIISLGLIALVSAIISGGESPVSAPAGLSAWGLASLIYWLYSDVDVENEQSGSA